MSATPAHIWGPVQLPQKGCYSEPGLPAHWWCSGLRVTDLIQAEGGGDALLSPIVSHPTALNSLGWCRKAASRHSPVDHREALWCHWAPEDAEHFLEALWKVVISRGIMGPDFWLRRREWADVSHPSVGGYKTQRHYLHRLVSETSAEAIHRLRSPWAALQDVGSGSELARPGWTWGSYGNAAPASFLIWPSPDALPSRKLCAISQWEWPLPWGRQQRHWRQRQAYLSGTRHSLTSYLPTQGAELGTDGCPTGLPWVPGCSSVQVLVSLEHVSPVQKGNLWLKLCCLTLCLPLMAASSISFLTLSLPIPSLSVDHMGAMVIQNPTYQITRMGTPEPKLFSESEPWCHVLEPREAEKVPKLLVFCHDRV